MGKRRAIAYLPSRSRQWSRFSFASENRMRCSLTHTSRETLAADGVADVRGSSKSRSEHEGSTHTRRTPSHTMCVGRNVRAACLVSFHESYGVHGRYCTSSVVERRRKNKTEKNFNKKLKKLVFFTSSLIHLVECGVRRRLFLSLILIFLVAVVLFSLSLWERFTPVYNWYLIRIHFVLFRTQNTTQSKTDRTLRNKEETVSFRLGRLF